MDGVKFSSERKKVKERKSQPLESLQVDKMSRLTAGVVAVGEDSGAGGGCGGWRRHVGARPHLQFHAPTTKNHSRALRVSDPGIWANPLKKLASGLNS